MPSIHAPIVSAWKKEESGRRLDDDAPDVFGLSRAPLLLDFEPKADEVGSDRAQPGRILLPLAPLREAKRGRAILSEVQRRSPKGVPVA